MSLHPNRREFLKSSSLAVAGTIAASSSPRVFSVGKAEPLFRISLTEYSLHRMMADGKLDNLDFTALAKSEFEIDAVEFWNIPFFDKATDGKYIAELRKRSDDAGIKGLVILIDGEGNLGDPDDAARTKAVENHHKWVEAAKTLGCHSIRVNARSEGTYEEQQKLSADGLRRLSEFAEPLEMNVIVENHGGNSSNGKWLAGVMEMVGMKNCGTLPDFGNFGEYDRYQGVRELMPYAKSVSAKSHDFNDDGNEVHTDYLKIMKIVIDAGYRGYVGIEYEGKITPEVEGVKLTKRLLERVREELSKQG